MCCTIKVRPITHKKPPFTQGIEIQGQYIYNIANMIGVKSM